LIPQNSTANSEEQNTSVEELANVMDTSSHSMVDVSLQIDQIAKEIENQKKLYQKVSDFGKELNGFSQGLIDQTSRFRVEN
jgi:methyl-accepting chemotaxis protein